MAMNKQEIEKLTVACVKKTGERRYRLDDADGNVVANDIEPSFLLAVRKAMFGTSPNRAIMELGLDGFEPFVKTAGWLERQREPREEG